MLPNDIIIPECMNTMPSTESTASNPMKANAVTNILMSKDCAFISLSF